MKKIFTILSLAVLLAGLPGCDDLLDKQPLSEIPETAYFRNAQDLEFYTNPLYNMLGVGNMDRQQNDHLVTMNLSEIIIGGSKRSVPNSGGGWDWADLRRINTLLARADVQCEDKEAVVKYSAVARFFRAMFYFNKVKRFGDVPWYDTELNPSDESLYNPRDPRELVMTKMVEDIDYAIANLPADVSVFRVNKWTALALKSRFCLYEGTYRKYQEGNDADARKYLELAAEAAKTLMDGNKYKLYTTGGVDKAYFTLFSQDNADPGEYILAVDYSSSPRVNHDASSFIMSFGQGRPSYTKKFVNTYLMKDGTRFTEQDGWETMTFIDEVQDRDPRLTQSIDNPKFTLSNNKPLASEIGQFECSVNGYHPIKFLQDPTKGYDVRVGYSSNDLPAFRYAEVLLNYAEAKAELGTLTQADVDISIKLLRDRVGMPTLDVTAANANPDPYLSSAQSGYTNVTGNNKGAILEVRRERAVELVEEGFRLDDLVRWKAGYCIDQPLVGIYFPGAGEYDLTGDGKADLILYTAGNEPADQTGVEKYEIGAPVGNEGMILTGGDKGNVFYHSNITLEGFNEGRDYLYPIPINERSLNHNLSQNPGWDDKLDF